MSEADDHLQRGEWTAAREAFRAELERSESAEAHEGLARASRALDDHHTAMTQLEKAFGLHVAADATADAARVAVALAEAAITSTGDAAVASGWLLRARRHLRDHPDDPAWPTVASMQAYVSLAYDKDPREARSFGEEALAHAQRLADAPGEVAAKGHLGLTLVSQGALDEGMRLLDEATAAAAGGEVSPEQALDAYCVLITACERVRDYARVQQWARHVLDEATSPVDDGFMIFARTEYAQVLVQTGHWEAANQQLRHITDDPDARPLATAMAWVVSADLQRLRGDLDRADQALAVAEREPYRRAVRHLAMAGRAAILLEQGRTQDAADLGHRYLRSVSVEAMAERVGVLETIVRACIDLGDLAAATEAAEELGAIAERIATDGVRAASLRATALVAARTVGPHAGIQDLDDAIELYDNAAMVPAMVAARVDLAGLHRLAGDAARASLVGEQALDEAKSLGASGLVEVAGAVLAGLRTDRSDGPANLTQREIDVLRLVAHGATNQDIADEFVLSVRTVERHLSNIYLKIGATGPSARSIATAFAHTHGVT